MSGGAIPSGGAVRGTLQPAKPTLDTVKCERCGCRFVPDENTFGCPGCEVREAALRAGWLDDLARE